MLLFMDGQAHYDTARIPAKYSSVDTTDCTWSITGDGRFGNALTRTATGETSSTPGVVSIAPLTTRLGAWTPTVSGVCGFAFKIDDLTRLQPYSAYTNRYSFFVVGSGASYHLQAHLEPSGVFTLHLADTPPHDNTVAVSIEAVTSGTWLFLEFKWLLHATDGYFQIRSNGLEVLSYTGPTLSTELFSPPLAVWTYVNLLGTRNTGAPFTDTRLCDLYLADLATASGADVSDYLGDGTIETIRPNGVGASSDWTPNTGTNWDATNDSPAPDDDATYVAGTTVGTTDTYHFQDITPGAIVKGAHVCILARKETEGSAAIAPVVHQGGTDYLGPTQGVANVLYDRYVTQAFDFNPATGAKFTASDVNGGQFGVQKMS